MERHICTLLLNVLLMFGLINPAFASPVATSFQLPLANYPADDACLKWGGYNSDYSGRHLADDACASAGTDVLAVANGVVKFAGQYKTCADHGNWGYLIIIEHSLSDGPYSEITCSYDSATRTGSCNAHGYISDWPGKYVDPTDFITSHSTDTSLPYTAIHDLSEVLYWNGRVEQGGVVTTVGLISSETQNISLDTTLRDPYYIEYWTGGQPVSAQDLSYISHILVGASRELALIVHYRDSQAAVFRMSST